MMTISLKQINEMIQISKEIAILLKRQQDLMSVSPPDTLNTDTLNTDTLKRSKRVRLPPLRSGVLTGEMLESEFKNNPVFTYKKPSRPKIVSIPVNNIQDLPIPSFTVAPPGWLKKTRDITFLCHYTPTDVYDMFAKYSDEQGFITKQNYDSCFRKIIKHPSRVFITLTDRTFLENFVEQLYEEFYLPNQKVCFLELMSGLTILCGTSAKKEQNPHLI